MSNFASLKKSSSNLEKLTKAIEQLNSSSEGGKSDDKFWRPEVDKAGNGMATFRFLPAPPQDGDDGLPWVKVFSHGFQGPGGWLIDNCLTTKNQQCPVCEHNNRLWNSGIEANKEIVRRQKRKLNYIANVYIVSDPKHPENEGQVKLFDDDDELEKVWKQEHSLQDLVSEKEFKSYDDLKARLDKVLGATDVPKTTVEQAKAKAFSAPKAAAEIASDDDDDMAYFSKLAEED